jgi:uncharacterized protein YggT (Ycf19 family)
LNIAEVDLLSILGPFLTIFTKMGASLGLINLSALSLFIRLRIVRLALSSLIPRSPSFPFLL